MRSKLTKIAVWVIAIISAFLLVVLAPPVAAGFIGVPFGAGIENPYLGILVGFVVSVGAMFLIMNVAEVAVILCAIQCRKVWWHYIERCQQEMAAFT